MSGVAHPAAPAPQHGGRPMTLSECMEAEEPAAPAPEPVAWIQADHLQKARAAPFLCRVEPTQRLPDFVPLYAHPAPVAAPATECFTISREAIARLCPTCRDALLPTAAPAPDPTATECPRCKNDIRRCDCRMGVPAPDAEDCK